MSYKMKCSRCGEEIPVFTGCSRNIVDFRAALTKHNEEKHRTE